MRDEIIYSGISLNLEQVTSDFNFEVVASYCSSFAGNLPTKKEVEAEFVSVLV